MFGWLRRLAEQRAARTETIVYDDHGFERKLRQRTEAMAWADVTTIYAFKRDLMAVDCLWLALVGSDPSTGIEVSEDAEGYRAFESEVERRFAIAPEWKLEVLFPAFETQLRQLYPAIAA